MHLRDSYVVFPEEFRCELEIVEVQKGFINAFGVLFISRAILMPLDHGFRAEPWLWRSQGMAVGSL